MKKRWLPFWIMPASFGLKGKAYEEAEAHYLLEGEELDRRLVEIRYEREERDRHSLAVDLKYGKITDFEYDVKLLYLSGEVTPLGELELKFKHGEIGTKEFDLERIHLTAKPEEKAALLLKHKHDYYEIDDYEYDVEILKLQPDSDDRRLALLGLELKYGKITEYEHDKRAILLQPEGVERSVALLNLDLAHDKIEARKHEKEVATLREEPWIGVIDDGFDLNQGVNGLYFELDWNSQWIDYLRLNGYGGRNEEAIVKSWFADVCMATVYESEAEQDASDPFPTRPNRLMNRIDRPFRL